MSDRPRKRTAVLVVHGMGSQRPLDTARGVVDAVWLEGDQSASGARRVWTHPELSGVDIDLPVITTNFVPGTRRRFDFHELYWAHLMSETRAVAVLLWLFELVRKGPRLKSGMRLLWWGASIFLTLIVLSAVFLVTRAIVNLSDMPREREALLIAPLLMIAISAAVGMVAAALNGALRFAAWAAVVAVAAAIILAVLYLEAAQVRQIATHMTPAVAAAVVVTALMGWWGLAAFACTYLLSIAFIFVQAWVGNFSVATVIDNGWVPWGLRSNWSALVAWLVIAMYLAIYGAFLQPYLGDAARYFRNSPGNVAVRREIRKQAVDTLEHLHTSGDYDRIVVVAHSLGTVIAYDMLRAYYGRINGSLPDPAGLGDDLVVVDQQQPPRNEARAKGRAVVADIAQQVDAAQRSIKDGAPRPGDAGLKAWLVTDFVTMGSPLTHAYYLMCKGKTEDELKSDFADRVREREFPICPPTKADNDGWLTYENPNDRRRYFHHGGQFALTRWTNLYFPVSQLLWGDAIGGPVAPVFGNHVVDVPVRESKAKPVSFFAHVLYWHLPRGLGSKADHIVALEKAIDLADSGEVNHLESASGPA
jgi:hypothetical protein